MQRLIINADDFGSNEEVTLEIERLIEEGLISSTTIMANGQCLDEVRKFTELHPNISYGIHLCLSEFSSLTCSPILNKYGITDSNGIFIKQQIFQIKEFPTELLDAIKAELLAQIDKVRELGISISHADSHHHVHTIYALRNIFKEVLNERNISKIRIGTAVKPLYILKQLMKNRRKEAVRKVTPQSYSKESTPMLFIRIINYIKLAFYRISINRYYRKYFVTTDLFCSFSVFMDEYVNCRNEKVIEAMCHPGHPGASYKAEITLLEKSKLYKNNINIISYNEL